MRYATKVDGWLLCLMTGAILLLVVQGVHRLWMGTPPVAVSWMLVGMAVFIAAIFYSFASYEITATEIIVRSRLYGFRFGSIPLVTIDEVRPTRNPMSAPAWSLNRLGISYRVGKVRRFALISPQDSTGFLRELARREPDLYFQGERLVRRSTNSPASKE